MSPRKIGAPSNFAGGLSEAPPEPVNALLTLAEAPSKGL